MLGTDGGPKGVASPGTHLGEFRDHAVINESTDPSIRRLDATSIEPRVVNLTAAEALIEIWNYAAAGRYIVSARSGEARLRRDAGHAEERSVRNSSARAPERVVAGTVSVKPAAVVASLPVGEQRPSSVSSN